jgi:hypothetical protein
MKKNCFYFVFFLSLGCLLLSCSQKENKGNEADVDAVVDAVTVEHVEMADPCIYLEGDTYYLYGTGGDDGILVTLRKT